MSKSAQVLRWLAVLPGAFGCVVLASMLIHLVALLIEVFGRATGDAAIMRPFQTGGYAAR
jgi:hypothetical protein